MDGGNGLCYLRATHYAYMVETMQERGAADIESSERTTFWVQCLRLP